MASPEPPEEPVGAAEASPPPEQAAGEAGDRADELTGEFLAALDRQAAGGSSSGGAAAAAEAADAWWAAPADAADDEEVAEARGVPAPGPQSFQLNLMEGIDIDDDEVEEAVPQQRQLAVQPPPQQRATAKGLSLDWQLEGVVDEPEEGGGRGEEDAAGLLQSLLGGVRSAAAAAASAVQEKVGRHVRIGERRGVGAAEHAARARAGTGAKREKKLGKR